MKRLLFFLFTLGIIPLLSAQPITFSYTGSTTSWTVPVGVYMVRITANGAEGGMGSSSVYNPGMGASMSGDFYVTPGDVLTILVGEKSSGNGGGGGSFVVASFNKPMLVAGGGGGSSDGVDNINGKDAKITTSAGSGSGGGGAGGVHGEGGAVGASYATGGGGGFYTNGANGNSNGGLSFLNGGAGGTGGGAIGGFGGGGSGSGYVVGGGGGGFSGGGGGSNSAPSGGCGGGGGSYNAGFNQSNQGGVHTGNGVVIIEPVFEFTGPTVFNESTCEGTNITLNGVGGAGYYNWYDAAMGGNLLGSGPSVSVGPISSTSNVYYGSVSSLPQSLFLDPVGSNNGNDGYMFDLEAGTEDAIIDGFNITISNSTVDSVWVYYKVGTYVGSAGNPAAWTKVASVLPSISGNCFVPVSGLEIPAGQIYGIYISTSAVSTIRYINADTTFVGNSLTFYSGIGMGYPFGTPIAGRTLKGSVSYHMNSFVDDTVNMPSHSSAYSGTRGYVFKSPANCVITSLLVPNDITGPQNIEVVRFSNGFPPIYSSTTNEFVSLGLFDNVNSTSPILTNIPVYAGDYIGIYGVRSLSTSYGDAINPVNIAGVPTKLYRSGMQFDMTSAGMHDVFMSTASSTIGRVEFTYITGMESGLEQVTITPIIVTADLGVDQDICINHTITLDAGMGFNSYLWSTSETTQTIDVDGATIGAGTFDYWVQVTDGNGCNGVDSVIVTVDSCTAIQDYMEASVSIYPNPGNGIYYIDLANINEDVSIEILDITGRVILRTEIREEDIDDTQNIDLSAFDNGLYFIRIYNQDIGYLRKLIKE